MLSFKKENFSLSFIPNFILRVSSSTFNIFKISNVKQPWKMQILLYCKDKKYGQKEDKGKKKKSQKLKKIYFPGKKVSDFLFQWVQTEIENNQ